MVCVKFEDPAAFVTVTVMGYVPAGVGVWIVTEAVPGEVAPLKVALTVTVPVGTLVGAV